MPNSAAGWTEWSKLHVCEGRELSLRELVELLEARLGMELSVLSFKSKTLYSSLSPPSQQKRWLELGLSSAVHEATGATVEIVGGSSRWCGGGSHQLSVWSGSALAPAL